MISRQKEEGTRESNTASASEQPLNRVLAMELSFGYHGVILHPKPYSLHPFLHPGFPKTLLHLDYAYARNRGLKP